MRSCAVGLLVLLGALFGARPTHAQDVSAQTGSVTGRVVDSVGGAGIPQVRVVVVGSSRSALTNDDGRFTITGVPVGSPRLRASRIGYRMQEQVVSVALGQAATANFALGRVAITLDQVVSVAYGTKTRGELTESVSSVSSEDLAKTTVNTLEQGLQGRVAGVQVTQGDAAPGGGMKVVVRGVNSMTSGTAQPLYVIDGVPVASVDAGTGAFGNNSLSETNPLATLSPSDIESIDVLKDASATALYGSRGSNGVVIITTKRGKRNRAGQLQLSVSQGYASVTKTLDVLTAPEFARYVNLSYQQGYATPDTLVPYGRRGSLTPDSIEAIYGKGINWQDLIYRTAPVRDGQLVFSGGDQSGSYMVSGNLLDQSGVILGSQFRRGGIRANLDRDINKLFRMSTNLSLTRSINNMVRTATTQGYRDYGIVRQAVTFVPMRSLSGDTATIDGDPRKVDTETWARYGADPLRYTDEVHEDDQITRGIGNLKVVTQLPAGFALDLSIGGNIERRDYTNYFPSTVNEGFTLKGIATQAGSEFHNILSENLLRYDREFGPQKVNAVAGFTYENNHSDWLSQTVSGFANDYLGANNLSLAATINKPQNGLSNWKLASYLGRVSYSAFDRYLLTATIRNDGASVFAKNNKWATFPSVAVAWRAIDEPYLALKERTPLNDLKFRLSYGRTGNQGISAYGSLAQLQGGTQVFGDQYTTPIYWIGQLENPNLKWETTDQYDAGLDVAAFKNRVTLTVDAYRKNTFDLLQNILVSPNTSFRSQWINSGNVSNKGIEFALNTTPVLDARHGFQWDIGGTASRNINRLESLGPIDVQYGSAISGNNGYQPFIEKPGLALGTIWGWQVEGIQTTQPTKADSILQPGIKRGDWRYRDLNGDGVINDDDRTVIGNTNPNWTWGINSRAQWGKFDLSILFNGVIGGNIINVNRLNWVVLNAYTNLPRYYVENAWSETNPDGIFPMINNGRQDNRFNDRILESATFARLKNLQLGYQLALPRAQSARVYVNAINLFTWTKYSGYDPEVSALQGAAWSNVDQGSYPQSRIFTFGVSTTF